MNYRISRYGALLNAIENQDNLYSSQSPLQLTSEEKDKILSMLNADLYLNKACTPVLLRLDEYLSGGAASYDFNVISVEHVLPQKPASGSEWLNLYPDEKERMEVVNKLGNLVLLSRRKNSKVSNYDFNTKKNKYFTGKDGVSPFAITTEVLREKKWNMETIQRRQVKLLNMLKDLWKL